MGLQRDKRYKLGDTWQCECGAKHKLSDSYLAAHWYIKLLHVCECHAVHGIQAGIISIEDDTKPRRKKKKS